MQPPSVLEVEEVAFRAWPAEEVQGLEGWRLRFTHGITRRANSVWPNAWQGETPLAERVAAVETFAAARGILPSYQLTSAAKPEHLDEFLSKRGYSIDAPVSVQTLALDGALPPLAAPGIETRVESEASADWLSVAVDRGRYAGTSSHELGRRVYLGILARIGPRAGFALAREGTEPVAVGLGVVDGGWLGVFGMITVPEARRRGAAKAILGALSRWGAERGATRAYLQVERENVAARAAYASAGFVHAYGYHYRTKFAPR